VLVVTTALLPLPLPYTAPGMALVCLKACMSSSGRPVPVTSLPMDTQKLRRLFLRAKISRYFPACQAASSGDSSPGQIKDGLSQLGVHLLTPSWVEYGVEQIHAKSQLKPQPEATNHAPCHWQHCLVAQGLPCSDLPNHMLALQQLDRAPTYFLKPCCSHNLGHLCAKHSVLSGLVQLSCSAHRLARVPQSARRSPQASGSDPASH